MISPSSEYINFSFAYLATYSSSCNLVTSLTNFSSLLNSSLYYLFNYLILLLFSNIDGHVVATE